MAFDQAAFDAALIEERVDLGLPPTGPAEQGIELAAGGRIINFDPQKHPRDPRGRFANILGDLIDKSTKSDEINLPGGSRVTRGRSEGYVRVKEPDGRSVEHYAKADDGDDVAKTEREHIAQNILDWDQREEEKVWRDADLDELEEGQPSDAEIRKRFAKSRATTATLSDGTTLHKDSTGKVTEKKKRVGQEQHPLGPPLKADASRDEISKAMGQLGPNTRFKIKDPEPGQEDWVVTKRKDGQFEVDDHSGRPRAGGKDEVLDILSPNESSTRKGGATDGMHPAGGPAESFEDFVKAPAAKELQNTLERMRDNEWITIEGEAVVFKHGDGSYGINYRDPDNPNEWYEESVGVDLPRVIDELKEGNLLADESGKQRKEGHNQRRRKGTLSLPEAGFCHAEFEDALAQERVERGVDLNIVDQARESAATGRQRAQTARAKKAKSSSSSNQAADPQFENKHPRGFGGKFITGNGSGAPQPVLHGIKKKLGGELSKSSIEKYQKQNGLQVDGLIGHQTASAILGTGGKKEQVGALTKRDKRRLFVTFKGK